MKRMILIISILSIFILTAKGPDDNRLVIVQAEKIRPYEAVFNAVCKVESNNDPLAIGDKHLEEYSYGVAQIRQIKLDDYFRQTGIRYTTKDCYSESVSKEIFMHHMMQYPNIEIGVRRWNGKLSLTDAYWKRIQKHL